MKKPIKHHTPTERMELRRRKRKVGPSALKRAERRKHLQPKPIVTVPEAAAVIAEK